MEKIANRLFNWASILEVNTREQALKTASMCRPAAEAEKAAPCLPP